MPIFISVARSLELFAQQVYLPHFVFLGSFLEEIIAPVPGPLVLGVAGSIAARNMSGMTFVFVLAIISAIGKTAASWLYYVLGDKAEDWITGKWGRIMGVSHQDIESLGKRLNSGVESVLLILLRALPPIPSATVSALCGIVKVPLNVFLYTCFIGFTIRNFCFLWLGYGGVRIFRLSLKNGFGPLDGIALAVLVAMSIALLLCYVDHRRGKLIARIQRMRAGMVKLW